MFEIIVNFSAFDGTWSEQKARHAATVQNISHGFTYITMLMRQFRLLQFMCHGMALSGAEQFSKWMTNHNLLYKTYHNALGIIVQTSSLAIQCSIVHVDNEFDIDMQWYLTRFSNEIG